jgi:transposase
MRKGFGSLCGIVQNEIGENPVNGKVYIFLNRRRTHIKLLHWENGGFVLYYKQLEQGNFELPAKIGSHINWHQLVMIIEGVSLNQIKMRKRYCLKNN